MLNGFPPNDYLVAAKFYDLFYNFWEDAGFYVTLAKRTGGPILDAMCGTGRIALPMARAGVRVLGVDMNDSMLEIMQQKLKRERPEVRSRVRIAKGDITSARLDGPFALAVLAWNSLPEITTLKGQQMALMNISRHMKPGALLALHTDNPSDVRPTWELFKGTGTTHDGSQVSMYSTTVKRGKNHYDLEFRYEISRPRKKATEIRTRVGMLFPTRKQVAEILESAGLTVVDVFGDYDLRPCTPRCKYMIFIARKPWRK